MLLTFWKTLFQMALTEKMYISDFSKIPFLSISDSWKNHIHVSLTVVKPAIHLSLSLKKTLMTHCILKKKNYSCGFDFGKKKRFLLVSFRLWNSSRSYFSDIGKNPENSFYVTIFKYIGKYGSFINSLEKKQLMSHCILEKNIIHGPLTFEKKNNALDVFLTYELILVLVFLALVKTWRFCLRVQLSIKFLFIYFRFMINPNSYAPNS